MFIKFKPNEIVVLKHITDAVRMMEKPETAELTPELLKQLCNRFLQNLEYFSTDGNADSLFEKPYANACGCMGPQNGEMYCNCEMSSLQYEYRYDIALKIISE